MLPSTLLQKKTFTKWANSKLATLDNPEYQIQDLATDLCDGHRLLALVRVLVKKTTSTTHLVPEKQHQRIHHIINVGKALKCIEQCTKMPLPNIGSEDIVDGNLKLTLGLIWLLILRFQIIQIADLEPVSKTRETQLEEQSPRKQQLQKEELGLQPSSSTTFEVVGSSKEETKRSEASTNLDKSLSSSSTTNNSKNISKKVDVQAQLLQWTKSRLASILPNAPLPANFNKAWQDGQHFCLLVHGYAPTHLQLNQVKPLNDNKADWKYNLDLAFDVAETQLHIPKLLDSEDLVTCADEKSIMTYLSGFCELPIPEPPPLPPPPQLELKPPEPQLNITTQEPTVQINESTKISPSPSDSASQISPRSNASPSQSLSVNTGASQHAVSQQTASPSKRVSLLPITLANALSAPISPISALTSYAASFVLPKSPVASGPSEFASAVLNASLKSNAESKQPVSPSVQQIQPSQQLDSSMNRPSPHTPSEASTSRQGEFSMKQTLPLAPSEVPSSSTALTSSNQQRLSLSASETTPSLLHLQSSMKQSLPISPSQVSTSSALESSIKETSLLTPTDGSPSLQPESSKKQSLSISPPETSASLALESSAKQPLLPTPTDASPSPVITSSMQQSLVPNTSDAPVSPNIASALKQPLPPSPTDQSLPRKLSFAESFTSYMSSFVPSRQSSIVEESILPQQNSSEITKPTEKEPLTSSLPSTLASFSGYFSSFRAVKSPSSSIRKLSDNDVQIPSPPEKTDGDKGDVIKLETNPTINTAVVEKVSNAESVSNPQALKVEEPILTKEKREPIIDDQEKAKAQMPALSSSQNKSDQKVQDTTPTFNQSIPNSEGTQVPNFLASNKAQAMNQAEALPPQVSQTHEIQSISTPVMSINKDENKESVVKEKAVALVSSPTREASIQDKELAPKEAQKETPSQSASVLPTKNTESLKSQPLDKTNPKKKGPGSLNPEKRLNSVSQHSQKIDPINSVPSHSSAPNLSSSISPVSRDASGATKTKSKKQETLSNTKQSTPDQQFLAFKDLDFGASSDKQFQALNQDFPSDKILSMALNHLSKQLELLPSNPASYQVRMELYQQYEYQFQALLARGFDLQYLPAKFLENDVWKEAPRGDLGALYFRVHEQLKKEGKILGYERHVHMMIGLGLVLFMTWAFFYLPILDVDAKDEKTYQWQ